MRLVRSDGKPHQAASPFRVYATETRFTVEPKATGGQPFDADMHQVIDAGELADRDQAGVVDLEDVDL
mgnify:CR=1 FL=1